MNRIKRVLKWAGIVVAVIVLVPVLVLGTFWAYYKSIVWEKPGGGFVSGDFAPQVNVFSGTGGIPYMCAYNTPAAQVPFGMVRVGPDTASMLTEMTALNASGYYYGDNKMIGFSHTRIVGADALEGGYFRIFPAADKTAAKAREALRLREKPPYAGFSHRDEAAYPGYYSVRLGKPGVLTELTATPRVGVHRYTFSRKDGDKAHLLLNATSMLGNGRRVSGGVRVLPDAAEVEGSVRAQGSFSGRYGGIDAYFVAWFSKPFAEYGVWSEEGFEAGKMEVAGSSAGADLAFAMRPGEDLTVEARVGISYVSIANARANLEAEAAGRNFDALAKKASDTWEGRLGCIRVKGGTDEQRRVFYTALYRAFQMPTTFCDVNGEYMGFDRKVHKADGFTYYTDFSLWDTFRTVHPLYNLVARGEQRDMMRSLVEMAKAGGCLPRWPSGCGYTNCMFGTPADIAVTEAYLKGVRDFDIETAYAAMRQTGLTGKPEWSEFGGRNGLQDYIEYGYLPSDKANKSVSATLEYAWSDHALSLLAHELGKEEDAGVFAKHAQAWHNLWDPARQYFVPRDSQGKFAEEVNPYILSYIDNRGKYTKHYVEGSGMQWRWGVPFDMQGLVDVFKSREYFIDELQTYLKKARRGKGTWNPGPYYWQGNEPYFHAAYLFNAAGRPDLTQKWVRWVIDTKYGDDYVGLDGNDDGGTLSAWYVWSALGLYPIAGTTRYELGAPLFEEAEVRIGKATLKIVAENYGPENIYARTVSLNDKPLDRTWITHDEIGEGGVLKFEMAAEAQ